MYLRLEDIRKLICWKTIGTDNERTCWAPHCPAWDLLVEVTYIDRCPHCGKKIKGADVLGAVADDPLGFCSATYRR